MKKLIKLLPLIIALTAIADTQMEVLKGIGMNEVLINYIKLFGLIISVFLPSINNLFKENIMAKGRNLDPKPKPVPPTKPPR
jgi:hypothetical protein